MTIHEFADLVGYMPDYNHYINHIEPEYYRYPRDKYEFCRNYIGVNLLNPQIRILKTYKKEAAKITDPVIAEMYAEQIRTIETNIIRLAHQIDSIPH